MIVKISEIKPNPKNPRTIRDEKFEKLKQSIQDFPDMLNKRPLVCFTDKDGKYVVLGGNMRLKASKEVGLKELPIILADEWTEEQKQEFLIKDNVGFGEWNWNELQTDWDTDQLNEWGLDVPVFMDDVDYSILDEEDLDDQLNAMAGDVKKAIQIEFEAEHYDEAYELVKFWRQKELYIGGFIMEKLKEEKENL